MSLNLHSFIVDSKGQAKRLSPGASRALLTGSKAFPQYADKTIHVALAYVSTSSQKPAAIPLIQCARVYCNTKGLPEKWHLSLVQTAQSKTALEAAHQKHQAEPLFWFPTPKEFLCIVNAVAHPTPRIRPSLPIHLRTPATPVPSVFPVPEALRPVSART